MANQPLHEKYAQCIAEQLQSIKTLYCPRCLDKGEGFKQPLYAVDNYKQTLLCPHCDLTVLIKCG